MQEQNAVFISMILSLYNSKAKSARCTKKLGKEKKGSCWGRTSVLRIY